jgi:hypothetical protein
MFAAKAAPTLRGFDKNISRRSGLAREFGVGFYALVGSCTPDSEILVRYPG